MESINFDISMNTNEKNKLYSIDLIEALLNRQMD